MLDGLKEVVSKFMIKKDNQKLYDMLNILLDKKQYRVDTNEKREVEIWLTVEDSEIMLYTLKNIDCKIYSKFQKRSKK